MKIEYTAIGTIYTPFKSPEGMPIQPAAAGGICGTVELLPEYEEGLQDLAGFSHIMLLYHLHRVSGVSLRVTPFLDSVPRGLFATRAPRRPNPIGVSVVKLVEVTGRVLKVENVDILDGTPLLDIKPYVLEFDHHQAVKTGWLEQARGRVHHKTSDDRFT
jgi:tRNA-Thr(GGU) m(6)t(6)A37 methyltransferase TsaA